MDGHPTHRTYIGTLFTVAYIRAMVAIVWTEIESYLDTSSPIAVGESFTQAKYPNVNLPKNKIYPVLLGYSNETELIKVEDFAQYITIKIQRTTWIELTKPTGEKYFEKGIELFEAVPCKYLSSKRKRTLDYMDSSPLFKETVVEYGICPDIPLNLSVEGKGTDSFYSTFDFQIFPCSLLSGCRSQNDIVKSNFQMVLPTSNLDISNLEEPISFRPTADDVFYINPTSSQVFSIKLKKFTVKDYIGLMPTWKERLSIHDIGSDTTTINYRNNKIVCDFAEVIEDDNDICQPYLHFSFQSSGVLILNKRSYKTSGETIGAIGGMNSILVIILVLIYGPINENLRKEHIRSRVYDINKVLSDSDKKTDEKDKNDTSANNQSTRNTEKNTEKN